LCVKGRKLVERREEGGFEAETQVEARSESVLDGLSQFDCNVVMGRRMKRGHRYPG
jgi:hypothetical protein